MDLQIILHLTFFVCSFKCRRLTDWMFKHFKSFLNTGLVNYLEKISVALPILCIKSTLNGAPKQYLETERLTISLVCFVAGGSA